MVDIEKLDSVINDLESSSKDVIKISEVLRNTEKIIDKTKDNVAVLDSLVNIINEAKDKSLLTSELCEKACKALDGYCMKNSELNANFISKVNTVLLEMKNESTSHYRELEATLTSKFGLFKSDVVVENRKISDDIVNKQADKLNSVKNDINNQTKENIDDLASKLNEKIDKGTKLLTILVCVSLVISIAGLIILLIK